MNRTLPLPFRAQQGPEMEVGAILDLIKTEHGLDFSGYRRGSVARRVEKRMNSVGLRDVQAYLELVQTCPLERERLIDSILINVTAFFRDASSWMFLADTVVPQLLTRREGAPKLRVWSAGCSTGEEPYT